MESSRIRWRRERSFICGESCLERVTLLPGYLSGCLDQEESTTSRVPTRRASMRLQKESVQLCSERCWCVVTSCSILFPGGIHSQKPSEFLRLLWLQGLSFLVIAFPALFSLPVILKSFLLVWAHSGIRLWLNMWRWPGVTLLSNESPTWW